MYKALFYKEWLKIKWVVTGLVLVNALVVLNIYLDLLNTFKERSANVVVGQFQLYEIVFYLDIKLIFLATGLLIGVFQFYPEINQSRLKLTFHLPVKENRLMLQMASVGILILSGIALMDTTLLSIICLKFLPDEFFTSMLVTTTPWYLGGLVCYFWVIIIFVEPNWAKRVLSFLIAIGAVSLYYIGEGYSKYAYSTGFFILLALITGIIIFLSSYNFKRGIC
jgi:hypothetical protein